ncbi:response regulator [Malaciobacter mytili]|uniref:response regulator n=1 Tax=Malaciobacter mytili TaxID=603050 RepID=UPI003A8A590E
MLPDKEGEELIKELSLLENNKNSKIIVLSGEQDIQKRNFLFEHGVVDYLSKQAPLKDLVEEIDTIISDILTNNKSSILVVDDSSFVRKTMKLVLSVKNYNILLAADVQEALEILKKQQVDLIFSDIM